MDKTKRYQGLIIFSAAIIALFVVIYLIIAPKVQTMNNNYSQIAQQQDELEKKKQEQLNVMNKLKKLRDSIMNSQKKIYSPVESDLGNDTLFFTLYNDVIEMLHANSIKIRSIDYTYNPETDEFVKFGKDVYFVCDVNMEIVSNYVNLGKLIQDLYQYPYYIRINEIEVNPYAKDKKILVSHLSLRLYAHTSPEEVITDSIGEVTIDGADTPLPQ